MADITSSVRVAAKPAKVFAALTQQKHLAAWFTPGPVAWSVSRLVAGQLVEWQFTAAGAGDWSGTTALFQLAFVGNWGTDVILTHSGWTTEESDALEAVRDRWNHLLTACLKPYLEAGTDRPAGGGGGR